jgi:hypothetical protein
VAPHSPPAHAPSPPQSHKENKGRHSQQHHEGGRSKKEELVPWGWEAAAKAERKQKAAENVAKEAAAKAAREFDPSNATSEKVV